MYIYVYMNKYVYIYYIYIWWMYYEGKSMLKCFSFNEPSLGL